jgi:hypothetical protein
MKKILTIAMFVATAITQAQEWTISEKSVTGIFNSSKSKSEIFTAVNKWISLNYNSAQNVIQLNDSESGTIIIKGINEITYSNLAGKVISKSSPESNTAKFNHTIEINVKENKFRVIYKLTDMISPDPSVTTFTNLLFDAIILNGDNSVPMKAYIDVMEPMLKKGFIGMEKREQWKVAIVETFKGINEKIISSLKNTISSIDKSILAEDKW